MKNRMTYDRAAVGKRLTGRRKQMGYTREYIANHIGIVEKYYADIERGTCGMSIETMMALADFYELSLDEFIYGSERKLAIDEKRFTEQMNALSPQEREYCVELVCLFIRGMKEKVQ